MYRGLRRGTLVGTNEAGDSYTLPKATQLENRNTKAVSSRGALSKYLAAGLGGVIFVGITIGLFDLANHQQSSGFTANAEALRRIALVELVIVLGGSLAAVWRLKTWAARLTVIALLTWLVSLPTLVVVAQVTVLP